MLVDAFLFYNELDLLELRLNTLDPVVDYFVISESPVMFSGLDKPLYFEGNKLDPRFKKFAHKIIHQIVYDTPDDYVNLPAIGNDAAHSNVLDKVRRGDWWPHTHAPYGRDTYQKESLIRPIWDFPDNTIVMLSDADEIPNPNTVKSILNDFNPNEIYNLKQKMYNYYLNCQKVDCSDDPWMGGMVLTLRNFKSTSMCEMKMRRRGIFVENGGWHFSYLGGREGALEKMISGNETAMYTDQVKNNIQASIDNCLTNGHDVYFRPCRYIIYPVDETYPAYILDNLDRFGKYIHD